MFQKILKNAKSRPPYAKVTCGAVFLRLEKHRDFYFFAIDVRPRKLRPHRYGKTIKLRRTILVIIARAYGEGGTNAAYGVLKNRKRGGRKSPADSARRLNRLIRTSAIESALKSKKYF